jgi:quinol monooxygenase YgiN
MREHTEDILSAVRQISEEARKHEGLIEIGAWLDKEHDRIVNISLWESQEQASKATKEMHTKFGDIPWNQWERRPAENFLGLTRVV